ncbi:transcription elongation factor, mitochondrial [Dendropsophus ebraccatus]|uniref:transcription elongation factor, mitochondrial n=1 Tax=Dendropsophus ebraccatus TaxID=150705 RepID=UPI003830FCE8
MRKLCPPNYSRVCYVIKMRLMCGAHLMPMSLTALINGGTRIFFRPLYCSRMVRGRDSPQEGPHGEIWAPECQPPDVLYGEEEVRATGSTKTIIRRGGANFLKPEVSIEHLQAADSILSIVFGMKRLAWAHVDRTLTVRAWHQHEWFHLMRGKQHPDLYLEDVSSAVSMFPAADLYILEKSSLSSQKAAMFPVILHLRIVEAMLYAILNPGYSREQGHRVFSMARTTVGKHCDIMVGGAKTSGVELVQRLVEEATILEQPRIRFTQDLITEYRHRLHPRGQNRNEEMCDALLQAVTFYELLYR